MNLISMKVHVCGAPPICIYHWTSVEIPNSSCVLRTEQIKNTNRGRKCGKTKLKMIKTWERGGGQSVQLNYFVRYPFISNFSFTHFPSTKSTKSTKQNRGRV